MQVLQAEYYHVIVDDDSDSAARMLALVSKAGISLLAYKSQSEAGNKTTFTLFAVKSEEMSTAIKNEGLDVKGPFPGVFIQGDDVPGALADIFGRLAKADIVVEESCGIANIKDGYGVVLYLRERDLGKAYEVLTS